MPSADHLRDVFQWDVRSWSRALPLWEKYLDDPSGKTALALGERDGGLSFWFAQQGYQVYCTDLNGPSDQAKALHERHGLSSRITYEAQDATALRLPDNYVEIVVFKSVIGALSTKDRQQQAVNEMWRVLKPGGVLLFAENLTGTAMHQALRKRFVKWDNYWRYLRVPDDLDLFHAFERVELRTTGFLANLGRSEAQRDLLARIDALIEPLVPDHKRCILLGAAVKPDSLPQPASSR